MKEFNYLKQEPFNFLGLSNQNYENSKVVIFPVPYSSTTYWKSGTKEGPQALIEASRHIELYDLDFKKDFSQEGIFTLDFLVPSKNSPREVVSQIKEVVDKILEDKKIPIVLGGEHSISLGPVLSFKEKFSNFSVLQIDAHTDLRDNFEGTEFHHACVMKRIRDLNVSVTQVGIRSVSEEESEYIEKEKIDNIFYASDFPIEKIINSLKENVYITFDLDGLDSSVMPSTGTPEPGGLKWEQAIGLIKEIGQKKRIIGADIVELDPIPGLVAPDFLAAKLVYKIIANILK